jgi:hypothetical protein
MFSRVSVGSTDETAVQMMLAYQQRIENLERQVGELRKLIIADEPATLPLDAAKVIVKKYFADHDGEVIYASDVADALNLRYDIIEEAISALEAEGKVAKS